MCGRINVIDSPGLQQLLRDLGVDLALEQRVNVAPTETVSLLREEGGSRFVDNARWWLTPSWAPNVDQKYAMFNARSEGLTRSRAFSQPFRCQRGLVPVSSFIEWRTEHGVKQPWRISSCNDALAIAALWDVWQQGGEPLLSCTLVTTEAARPLAPWHRRMPVLLAATEWDRWLDNTAGVEPMDAVFRNELKFSLALQRLPLAASNARNKDAALMEGEGAAVILEA